MNTLDMGTARIVDLVRIIAVPACVGMLFNTLYNLVDVWFAGWLAPSALAALSISSSLFFLMLAMGVGIGQSANAAVGFLAGQKQPQAMRRMAAQSLVFALMMSLLATALVSHHCHAIFMFLGADIEYLQEAVAYTRILLWVVPLFCLGFVCSGLLNTQGDSRSYRNALIFAFVINMGLDPLLMTRFGLPGIAFATVFSQVLVLAYLYAKVRRVLQLNQLDFVDFWPRWHNFTHLFRLAAPASFSMIVVAFGTMILVSYVANYGQDAMAAIGIALRIEQVVLLPMVGLGIAASSLCAFNYGVRNIPRISHIYRVVLSYSVVVALVGAVVLIYCRYPLLEAFSSEPEVQNIGAEFLFYCALMLPANAAIFTANSLLQGLRCMGLVLVHSVWRQVLLPVLALGFLVSIWRIPLHEVWQILCVIMYASALLLNLNVMWVLHRRVALESQALVQTRFMKSARRV